jgi:predicted DNA binding CopG/RHH family protein
MKKNCSIHIALSKEDLDRIKKKAATTSLPLSTYCLFLLLNANPKIIHDSFKENQPNDKHEQQ